MTHYDIIGDIHGCADKLEELLHRLGYEKKGDVFRHPERTVIFLGDFIDRGRWQKQTLDIVRPMVEAGEARTVMGNHEFNAICYATKTADGYIRPHNEKNTHQHAAFLSAYPFGSDEYWDAIEWFKTLPVYLDLGNVGIIHACWCKDSLEILGDVVDDGAILSDDAYRNYADEKHSHYQALEKILKGPEFSLPKELYFRDNDGHERQNARLRWWMPEDADLHEKLELSDSLTDQQKILLNNRSCPAPLPEADKLIFVGHYWLRGTPERLSRKIACVDYSVAKGGYLTAYRYSGEEEIRQDHFIWV